MKRIICMLLVMLMVLACFVGCTAKNEPGNTTETTPSPAGNTQTATPAPSNSGNNEPATEPAEEVSFFPRPELESFTLWLPWSFIEVQQVWKDYNDSLVYQEMEKRTNVHLDMFMPTFRSEKENLSIMLASLDYPDVIVKWDISGSSPQYAIDNEIGIVVDEYVDKYMPNYKAIIADPEVRRDISMDDGHMGALWCFNSPMQLNWNGMCIRKDFLDKLGLEIPETYDEMHEVLVAFRDQLNLPAPMNLGSDGDQMSYLMSAGYGAIGTIFQRDGVVKYGPLEPEYRAYVEMMRQWYAEKLIDPEFEVNHPLFGNGETMLINDQVGYSCGVDFIGTWEDNGGIPINKDFDFYPTKNLVLNKGEHTHFGVKKKIVEVPTVITTQAENLELIFRWFDNCFTEESFVLLNYGVEGVTFFYDENHYPTLNVEWLENYFGVPYTPNFGKALCSTRMPYLREQYRGRDTKKVNIEGMQEYYFLSGEIWGQDDGEWLFPEGVTCSLTADEQAEYSAIFNDVDTLKAETVLKIIKGIVDMSAYDEMVKTMKSMNIDRAIELKQASLDRYNARLDLIAAMGNN